MCGSRCWLLLVLLSSVRVEGKKTTAQKIGKWRSAGDMAFGKGDMAKAKKMFSKVIKAEPKNERNYYKRFRVFLKERKYQDAVEDLTTALGIDPKYKQGLLHRGKVYKTMGLCQEAHADFTQLLSFDPKNKKALDDLPAVQKCAESVRMAHEHKSAGRHHQAHVHYTKALEHTTGSIVLNMARAQCSFEMGEYFEVLADTGRALKIEKENIDSLILRGNAYYKLGEFDMAVRHYRQGLHYDPEHKPCKTAYRKVKKLTKFEKNGDEEVAAGKHKEAVESFTSAINVDPEHNTFNGKTLLKICQCHVSMKAQAPALLAADQALARDPKLAHAYSCKSEAHSMAEEWQEAVNAAKKAVEMDQEDRSLKESLQKAEAALKQSKTKNYYKILDVPRDVEKKALKKAYRKLALLWHPDKHPGEEKQKVAASKFADIGEAYEVLNDEEKRAKYDRGEDVFDNQGGGGGQPRHMFHHGGQQFQFNFGM